MNADTEKALCLKNAAAIAARHASPAALEAATADIAAELERARAAAVKHAFREFAGFDKSTVDGAQRCLKKASLDAALLGDLRTSLGLMGVGIMLKVIFDTVHAQPAQTAPAGATAP